MVDEEWERYYDSTSEWWYRYNHRTGESEWEDVGEEVKESSMEAGTREVELKSRKNVSKQQKERRRKKNEGLAADSLFGGADRQYAYKEGDHEETTLVEDIDRIFAETEGDIVCYYRCMILTACVFEGPVVVLEAILRALCFFFMGIIYILLAILRVQERDYWYLQAKKCMREVLLCLAAALTFIVPCTGCCVYRAYRNDETEWDLAPMPTLLGWVDTRRFFTFCLGGGKLAVRGRADFIDDDDYETDDVEQGNQRGYGQRQGLLYERAFDIHMRTSGDTWKGGIPFAPRKVSRTLSNVLNGDDESLGDVEAQMMGAVA